MPPKSPKGEPEPVTLSDVETFLKTASDFAFEMDVLSELERAGFSCRHGGTYIDPITTKARQFDIRAHRSAGRAHLDLAVECKNLRPFAPLLVHRVPRRTEEAFHTIIRYEPLPGSNVPFATDLKCERVEAALFQAGQPSGKRVDQLTRHTPGAEVQASDRDTFDKISQAISSARELTVQIARSQSRGEHLVLPLLVVPDGRLWSADYGSDGSSLGQPVQSDHVDFFIDQTWEMDFPKFTLSHTIVATKTGLPALVENRLSFDRTDVFPPRPFKLGF